MRIVHEIYGRFQSGGGATPYLPTQGEASVGARFELTLCAEDDSEVIHLEGDADDMIDMLMDAIRVIEMGTEGMPMKRQRKGCGT